MLKNNPPDYEDAQLLLRLYELRREPVMRESRAAVQRFNPKSYEELLAVTRSDHPANAAWRQVTTYWEMAYGMARHGIINADYLAENSGEGLFPYAKAFPWLDDLRRDTQPNVFKSAEWLVAHSDVAKASFERIRKRVEAAR